MNCSQNSSGSPGNRQRHPKPYTSGAEKLCESSADYALDSQLIAVVTYFLASLQQQFFDVFGPWLCYLRQRYLANTSKKQNLQRIDPLRLSLNLASMSPQSGATFWQLGNLE